jgi:uncharacterized protein (TIGR03118 family)
MNGSRHVFSVAIAVLAAGVLSATQAQAQHYTQTNLVSDQPGAVTPPDANLVNPWGLARSSTSVWWVGNNLTGTATLYNGNTGAASTLVVSIPSAAGNGPGLPTAVVSNPTDGFELTPGHPARFIFVTKDGTVSGWNPQVDATHAQLKVPADPGDAYTGAALAFRRGAPFLYVANFTKNTIEIFDTAFHNVDESGDDSVRAGVRGRSSRDDDDDRDDNFRRHAFRDTRLPRGFAPFNIQNIGGDLYVTYAKFDPVTIVATGPGLGFVDVFDTAGRLLRRLQHGPWLNAPWGLALAPSDFGAFSHNLLVGEFRSGEISAYDVVTGLFLGKVLKAGSSEPFVEDSLWSLSFGNGGNAGPLNTLFFTAGIEGETHGLFGTLTAVSQEQQGNIK